MHAVGRVDRAFSSRRNAQRQRPALTERPIGRLVCALDLASKALKRVIADDTSTTDRAKQIGGKWAEFGADQPLTLDSGTELAPFTVAYQTYGTLNAAKSNVILLCHALTGDQFVAGTHPLTGKPGWWDRVVGPGKVVDTDRFFVICANVLGSCMGTTGPMDVDPQTGRPWGLTFPVITIADMVRTQARLLDHLGIDDLFCVMGGSMGGMQVLQWAASYPDRVFAAAPIATTYHHTAQNIAFHEVGRQAIMADPGWQGGAYSGTDRRPTSGLAVARMAAHITYMSEEGLTLRFGRSLAGREEVTFGFDADFQIESYLRHQGITFVDRFDANSYLYITRAMDYFDLAAANGGRLADAFRGSRTRFCVLSFSSDWLYPTAEAKQVVQALTAAGARVSFTEIDTTLCHDSFLLNVPEMDRMLTAFLDTAAQERGL